MAELEDIKRVTLSIDDLVHMSNFMGVSETFEIPLEENFSGVDIKLPQDVSIKEVKLESGETTFATEKFLGHLEHNVDWEVIEDE